MIEGSRLAIKIRVGDVTHSYTENDLPQEFAPYLNALKVQLLDNPHASRALSISPGLVIHAYYKRPRRIWDEGCYFFGKSC